MFIGDNAIFPPMSSSSFTGDDLGYVGSSFV